MTKPARPRVGAAEAARLKASGDALRQAAALPGARLESLLEAALAELDGAAAALAAGDHPARGLAADPADAAHAERRLLHGVFQQAPVPMFLLGLDGTVRRANSAAGELVGSGPGYLTGRPFAAFIDLPFRAALGSQIAAVVRTGGSRRLRCSVLTAGGAAECEVLAAPLQVRGDSGQLIVAVGAPGELALPGGGQSSGPTGDGDGVLRAATRRLDLVTSASRILLENVNHSASVTMQRFARLLARELSAWLILDVERHQRLRRQLAVGPEDQASDGLARAVATVDPSAGSAADQVHRSGRPLLVAHAEDQRLLGDGPEGAALLMLLRATSVLCVPLRDGERSYGALTLARGPGQGPFGLADAGLAEELGEQLALAIRMDRTMRHRAEIADALQASLVPRRPRQIPGTEVAVGHIPASSAQEAGGDFYDVYPARDGWGVCIGDVCGRGQEAAAVTAAARHAIRVLAHWHSAPADVLRSANEIMLEEDFGGQFVTADVGHVQWRDGSLHVVLGSAGHPWPVLVRPDGRTEVLQGGGLPLGIFPDAQPTTQELDLDPGDLLFFFTDGLASVCGPNLEYFDDRVADELSALAGQPATRVVSRLHEVVTEFCGGELRDDVTMLALRAGEPPAG